MFDVWLGIKQITSKETNMTRQKLNRIIKQHKLWLDSKGKKGRWANLQEANLQGANLQGFDLQMEHFVKVNLQGANLQSANLQSANFIGANLKGVNLEGADLKLAFIENKPTPFVLGNQLIVELDSSYEEQKNRGYTFNRIKKWTELTDLTKALFL